MSTTKKPAIKVYSELQQAYDYFNNVLFNQELPDLLLTLQRGRNTFGYFAPERFTGESNISELAMNPDYLDDRKDSLTFGNNPESYNQLDLYNRIANSINERLMRVTASIGLHSEKCDRNTLRNTSLFSKSQQSIQSGGF